MTIPQVGKPVMFDHGTKDLRRVGWAMWGLSHQLLWKNVWRCDNNFIAVDDAGYIGRVVSYLVFVTSACLETCTSPCWNGCRSTSGYIGAIAHQFFLRDSHSHLYTGPSLPSFLDLSILSCGAFHQWGAPSSHPF